jgi:hypothetical protein
MLFQSSVCIGGFKISRRKLLEVSDRRETPNDNRWGGMTDVGSK